MNNPCDETTFQLGWAPLENRTNNIQKMQIKVLFEISEIFCPGYFSFQQALFYVHLSPDAFFPWSLVSKALVHLPLLTTHTHLEGKRTNFSIYKFQKQNQGFLSFPYNAVSSPGNKATIWELGLMKFFHTNFTLVHFSYTIFFKYTEKCLVVS